MISLSAVLFYILKERNDRIFLRIPEIRKRNESVLDSLLKGDLVEFKRRFYSHWGVYIGEHNIIHLTGVEDVGNGSSVKMITVDGKLFKKAVVKMDDFWTVVSDSTTEAFKNNDKDKKYSPRKADEIVETAKETAKGKLKEKGYHLLWNNCEHFASFCRYGKKISDQTENFLKGCQDGVKLGIKIAQIREKEEDEDDKQEEEKYRGSKFDELGNSVEDEKVFSETQEDEDEKQEEDRYRGSEGAALFVGVQNESSSAKHLEVIPDIKRLTNSFKKLGYNCQKLQKDVTYETFEKALDEIIKDVIDNKRKYLVVSISSHGEESLVQSRSDMDSTRAHFIWFHDGKHATQNILDRFKKEEKLKDVIKLVIISACRSRPDAKSKLDNIDQGVQISLREGRDDEHNDLCNVNRRSVVHGNEGIPEQESVDITDKEQQESCNITGEEQQKSVIVPDNVHLSLPKLPKNCILWYASPSGKYEYQSNSNGSFFVEKVCNELDQIPASDSRAIMDVMCSVHHSVATMEEKTYLKTHWKTVPCFIHTLTKSFDFVKA